MPKFYNETDLSWKNTSHFPKKIFEQSTRTTICKITFPAKAMQLWKSCICHSVIILVRKSEIVNLFKYTRQKFINVIFRLLQCRNKPSKKVHRRFRLCESLVNRINRFSEIKEWKQNKLVIFEWIVQLNKIIIDKRNSCR